ncbi:membrane-spanning 4-domains subfamily A member 8-like isoform X2 [Pseudonaja textilis]|uniref:membrane-spanning 4-domains subfamily A member 8-like isoform X2 n=1 Tax=Pseudonaja textilis TaxID=8673 RepID=UPI000EA94DE6|nr:membrane-spanning 4-domains subfamily A member 8-like isoform X2 [Pseudonaja textilis]
MASGNMVVMPSKEVNIQTASGLPGPTVQASGATPYPQHGAQQLGTSTSAPQQVPKKSSLEKFLKAETKVFGAVQIMIGLIHIFFGIVIFTLPFPSHYGVIIPGGYPFWGGIFFISSGSLCVAAANLPNCGLVKSSVGMNITSAIMALCGIILYMCELIIYSPLTRHQYISQYTNDQSVSKPILSDILTSCAESRRRLYMQPGYLTFV